MKTAKITYTLALLFLISNIGFSQTSDTTETKEEIYTIVEAMPEFPGGQKALFEYLGNNITYPPKAKSKGIKGKVYVNFTIYRDGSIRDAKVIKKAHRLLDKEALRVIKAMPNWIPGTQEGKTVSVSYNLPINFKFSDNDK